MKPLRDTKLGLTDRVASLHPPDRSICDILSEFYTQ